MPALKIGAANQIHGAQSRRHGAAEIDAEQIGVRNLACITLDEIESAQTNVHASPQQRQQCLLWSGCQFESRGGKNGIKNFETLLDMSAHQQLLSSSTFEIQAARN